MSTTLTYGFGIALVGFLVNAALYFMGFHTDPARFALGGTISFVLNMVALVVLMVLGVREARTKTPIEKPFGYGAAFKTAFLIGLFACIGGVIAYWLYILAVNSDYLDMVAQVETEKMRVKGAPENQIAGAEEFIRKYGHVMATVFTVVGGLIVNTIIALIVAVFTQRKEAKI